MGKGKNEMVVADDEFREHVRATIYCGKGDDDRGKGSDKGKGHDEMGYDEM